MGKIKIQRGWYEQSAQPKEKRLVNLFEQVSIRTKEDLPQLLSAKEAAEVLRCTAKTAADLMAKQIIQSMKLRGRRFTTPEWIADYMRREQKAHG